ncbi:ABC transporter permease [Streptacidiphilus sp. EB129]|uniref:ABC transporter permease n=1 Tax=Streptacidiphilus sp. EB129 TaxID=3156262 RepID=UPI0035177921
MTTASTLTGNGTAGTPLVKTDRRSKLVGGIAQAVVGLYGLWAFGLGSRTAHGAHTLFALKLDPTASGPSPFSAPAQPWAIALTSIAVICGLVRAFAPISAKTQRWLAAVYYASFVLAFLVWAAAGTGGLNVPSIIQQATIGAVPLVLGSLSALLCERSGVVNIAVEGQFLFGAFSAALTASITHSVWAGLVAGCLGGALMCALLAVLANRYLIEQVVLGVVLNLLASGITGFLYDRLMSTNGAAYNTPPGFQPLAIPGLSRIPVIGAALFDENILFYAAYLLVPIIWFLLFRTRWGLRTRAVGEHPTAADTVGIKVIGLRYRNVITAGLLSGLGGVWLTLGLDSQFGKDMSDGKGYIAIAALIVGRWSPYGALGAAMLFGFATELNVALSPLGTPIPGAFLSMAPYLVTIFVVAAIGGMARPPAASGKPYVKG